eukprot:TRINITY_DN2015_c0_g1_i7.p2 TRINITY_DN2015_c0_g1~~TRINITY_DN2015_c0_g1_i7.p2  ORF type:complete len:102 (-),score=9.30 TRINITY_DN2015_c0_g1_i7:4-309(-)
MVDISFLVHFDLGQILLGTITTRRHVILLIPIRSASRYWNEYILPHATDFWFLPSITFQGYTRPLLIPLCLVEFDRSKTPIFSKVHQETTFPMWTFKTPSA